MNELYMIGAYWGSKAETLFQVRDKVLLTLQRIASVDEQFLTWYERGRSRKQALETKVDLTSEYIEGLCRKAIKKGELDNQFYAKNGFVFGLWTGHRDDESGSISFSVGDSFTVQGLSNSCYIDIPSEGSAYNRLIRLATAKQLLAILVDIWKPDYAIFTSVGVRDELGAAGSKFGIISYQKVIGGDPKKLEGVCLESSSNGFWFSPCDDNYDQKYYLASLKNVIKLIQ
jgi:hypothetical protein